MRAVSSGSGARSTPNDFSVEPTTLVNTRRIGGTAPQPDVPPGVTIADVELGKPTELAGAAKITGQRGSLRYGVMGAFEEEASFSGSLPNQLDDGFGDLFHNALTDPIIDRFVVKLRYRFGR